MQVSFSERGFFLNESDCLLCFSFLYQSLKAPTVFYKPIRSRKMSRVVFISSTAIVWSM